MTEVGPVHAEEISPQRHRGHRGCTEIFSLCPSLRLCGEQWRPDRLWPRVLALACPLAICLLSGCCVEREDAIKRHGEPDIVYELRGATGRWYRFGQQPSPHPLRPDEIGFIWLDDDHQATFEGDCQTYSGPLRSDDWRRFEQDRTDEMEDEIKADIRGDFEGDIKEATETR